MGKKTARIEAEFIQFSHANASLDTPHKQLQFSLMLFQKDDFQYAAEYAKNALNAFNEYSTATVEDYQFLAQCFYAANELESALACVQKLLDLEPNSPELLIDAGLYTFLLGQNDEAENYFLAAYDLDSNNSRSCDGLAHLYDLNNNIKKSHFFGNRSLELKDKEAFSTDNISKIKRLIGQHYAVTSDVPEFNSLTPSKNIIAFSLWGEKAEYIEGAILNATLAPIIYPSWQCRFYCDTTISPQIVDRIRSLGSDVRVLDKNELPYFGLFWRFFIAEDPSVDRYIIRDCDCVLNCQERVAVDEWIESKKHFHIMRDYASHTELIHAGMWGGVRGALPSIGKLIVDYYDSNPKERTIDQQFLRHYIWPIVKQSYLSHDSIHSFGESQKFNKLGQFPHQFNVGINWQNFFKKE